MLINMKMLHEIRWREMLACLLIISLSLALRLIIWIYPGYGWNNLTIYDVNYYTSYGRKFIESLSKGDFLGAASMEYEGPPLGILLVGLSSYLFGPFIGDYKAGLLAPIISSSLTMLLIFLIMREFFRLSVKYAIAGSLILSLDPYLVQFSAAYLDSIGTFFLIIAIYAYLHFQDLTVKRGIIIGLLIGLAGITKLSFLIFALFFALLLGLIEKKLWAGLSVFLASLLLIPVIPWIWYGETLSKGIARNLAFNSLLPPIIFGPIMIDIPEAYPWYILTYFGLGQIHWRVLPSTSHCLLFCSVLYKLFSKNPCINRKVIVFLLASILMIVFIPRNYWTTAWGGGAIIGEGVLLKQFYPYYFYPINLVVGLAAYSFLFLKSSSSDEKPSIAISPVIFYSLTAPFTAVMNTLYPYWDFIFTLIMNFSRRNLIMAHYGFMAIIITSMMLLALTIITIIISKKIN